MDCGVWRGILEAVKRRLTAQMGSFSETENVLRNGIFFLKKQLYLLFLKALKAYRCTDHFLN